MAGGPEQQRGSGASGFVGFRVSGSGGVTGFRVSGFSGLQGLQGLEFQVWGLRGLGFKIGLHAVCVAAE